jgi:transcriptional regulator with XRE-family HTH domain
MRQPHSYLQQTHDAVTMLGLQIAHARRQQRMTSGDLCQRAQISPVTLRNVERGVPTVAIGIYFEVASLLGIQLYDVEPNELPALVERGRDRLFLLPSRVRETKGPLPDGF